MTALDLLTELRSRGVMLEAAGGRLRVDAPKGILTPELRADLAAHKKELLTLLAPVCPVCGGALSVEETDRYRAVQCTASPLDYYLITNKRPGSPMGQFTTERAGDECVDCQTVTTTYNHRCADCLSRWCAGEINGQAGEGE